MTDRPNDRIVIRPRTAEEREQPGDAVVDSGQPREATGAGADADEAANYAERGRRLAESGRPLEAIPLLERAAALTPDSATAQYNLGVVHMMVLQADAEEQALWAEDHLDTQDHYFAAQSAFQAALDLDPSLTEAQTNLDILSRLNLATL